MSPTHPHVRPSAKYPALSPVPGSVLPPIAAHVVCNALGLPDLDFLRPASSLHRHRHLLAASLVAGPVLFSFALWTAPL